MAICDKNHDGIIDFNEFMSALMIWSGCSILSNKQPIFCYEWGIGHTVPSHYIFKLSENNQNKNEKFFLPLHARIACVGLLSGLWVPSKQPRISRNRTEYCKSREKQQWYAFILFWELIQMPPMPLSLVMRLKPLLISIRHWRCRGLPQN